MTDITPEADAAGNSYQDKLRAEDEEHDRFFKTIEGLRQSSRKDRITTYLTQLQNEFQAVLKENDALRGQNDCFKTWIHASKNNVCEAPTQGEAIDKVVRLISLAESLGQRPYIAFFDDQYKAAWGLSFWTDTLNFKVIWPRFQKLLDPQIICHSDLDRWPTEVPLPVFHLGTVKDWLKGPPENASFVIHDDVMARAFDFVYYNFKDHTSHILRISLVQVRELLNDDPELRGSMQSPAQRWAYGGYGKARHEAENVVLEKFGPRYVFGTEESGTEDEEEPDQ